MTILVSTHCQPLASLSKSMLATLLCLLIVGLPFTEALPFKNSSYYVDGSAVVVFGSQLPPQVVNEVLESTLYAQMMANHAYNRFSDFSQWYTTFTKAYGEIGWTIYMSDFELNIDNYSSSDEDAISKILTKDLSESELNDVHDALEHIYNNRTLAKLFDEQTSQGSFSTFQILVLKMGDSGNIIMSFTAFVVNAINSKFRELFCSFVILFIWPRSINRQCF